MPPKRPPRKTSKKFPEPKGRNVDEKRRKSGQAPGKKKGENNTPKGSQGGPVQLPEGKSARKQGCEWFTKNS